jgi:hypothetical protein
LGQRNRKRGQRSRPAGASRPAVKPAAAEPTFAEHYRARSEERNAAVRAGLVPLAPGERPWPILVGVGLTAVAGIGNLILYAAGATIQGKHPAAGGIVVFSIVMLACSIGMWRLWYQAVLAFMVLLAIIVVLFSLFLVEASNLLGFLVPPIFIVGGGYLFWKLVRVLSRLQMPARP